MATTTISTRKFPGIPAYSVRVNGRHVGVVRQRYNPDNGTSVWRAVSSSAGALGEFPSKVQATDAVAKVVI